MTLLEVGVFLPTMTGSDEVPGDVTLAARHAEELGFESAWVVDQLVAGSGVPFLESTTALAAVAAATTRIRLGLGVLVLPLRPVAWVAKQVATLQHLSGDRLILGVGAGGDRHDRSWAAVGLSAGDRARRTDAALRVLPGLVAGEPTALGDSDGDAGGAAGPVVRLAPGATVPPLLVGGMSAAAVRRVADHGEGWFLLPVPPAGVADARAQLTEALAARGRPASAATITVGVLAALDGDPALPGHAALVERLSDPEGMFGIPAELVPGLVTTGGPAVLADLLRWHAEAGADRVVLSVAAGDWFRQVELVAEAAQLAGGVTIIDR
jgi:alkanesulfonate monooxygenase SsuD/methylene tetrahydromethanopterin reductase-like flavin-dependent oxidoreductase (luciferase family)